MTPWAKPGMWRWIGAYSSDRGAGAGGVPSTRSSLQEASQMLRRVGSRRSAIGAALRTWKGSMVLVSHDTEFVTELEPDRVLVMPDGTVDHWSDDLVDLVALA